MWTESALTETPLPKGGCGGFSSPIKNYWAGTVLH